ncbi:hypothetical protein EFA46_014680 (plasmid) [Halarchaeum sp. CBA1220]|uniref:hypothetical protein n=1 Tax=Halarchaeum sp. CBA1220 TaxID=1853682 RepID=UPI000F3A9F0A|nr:hypothetical protein [Halarchaeum sp. CBA1220]QLC35486.1 hypothetical protein EFA46_014680 [Halarchaeum sp. CBA1220]
MTDTTPSIDRRSALQAFGSLTLAALAGCTGNGDSGPSGSSTVTPAGPFASLDVQGTTLVVELESGADAEHVNLVKPNGSLFGTRDVAQGASRVSFDLGTTYTPGEYELVAVTGDQTIGTTTRTLQPDLQILEMGIGRNQPEQMWNGPERSPQTQAFVTIENRGSGPTAVTQLLFFGKVPYPSGENGTQYAETDISGIYDPESNTEIEQVVVPPGGSKTIYSSRMPFAFIRGGNVVCQDQPQSGTFELVLETSTSNTALSKRYDIRYSASEEFNDCSIEVGEDS